MQLARKVASMTRLLETREREIDSLRQIIEFVIYFSHIRSITILVGRPTKSSANLGSTAVLSPFYSPATLRSRWTELNQNQLHAQK